MVRRKSFGAQRLHWIDERRATRGDQTSKERGGSEEDGCAAKQGRILRRYFEQLRCKQTPEDKGCDNSDGETNHNGTHSLGHDQLQYIARLGAQRHADTDFAGALRW